MDMTKGYSIACKGLKNGVHDFSFKVDGALFEAYGNEEIKGGDCDVAVTLTKADAQFMADVSIRGSVVVACDRCLEDCRVPIVFEGRLLVKVSDEVHEYDGETLWLLPGEDEIDLAQYIYESIVLSLPYRRVHPEGECDPGMLRRFRIVSDEEFARIESRAGAHARLDAWDRLAGLKQRMEADAGEEPGKKDDNG